MDAGLERFSLSARQAILGIIDGLTPEQMPDGRVFAEGIKRLHHLDDEAPDILEEVMNRGGHMARLFAALSLIVGTDSYPSLADDYREVLERARETVTTSIEEAKDQDSLETVLGMIGRMGGLPDTALPLVEKLLGEDNERPVTDRVAAYAATALTRASMPEAVSRGLQRLVVLLKTDSMEAVLLAAPVLLKHDWQSDRAVNAVVKILPRCNWMDKCGLVRILRDSGPRALALLPMLRDVFADKEVPTPYRGQAAAAIGSVAKGSDEDVSVLSGALLSSDWEIVNGAIEGLHMHDSVKEADVIQLASHLSADDRQLRYTAASNLQRLGPLGRPALPALLERLGEESDPELCKLNALAIASVGMDAVEPLIEEAHRQDFRTYSLVALALKTIGDEAIEPIIEKLLGSEHEEVRVLGILVLKDMGSKAAPALPVLTKLLLETRDVEMAVVLIQIMGLCGRAAASAVDAIISVLISCDYEDVEDAAARTLQRIGKDALPALENAASSETGAAKLRLVNVIAAVRRRGGDRFEQLEGIHNDNLVRYFVLVAQYLERHGPASWSAVGETIERHVAAFRSKNAELGTSGNAVRDNVKRLATLLNKNPLTTHKPQRAGTLSSTGKSLLREATEYLRSIYGAAPDIGD